MFETYFNPCESTGVGRGFLVNIFSVAKSRFVAIILYGLPTKTGFEINPNLHSEPPF